MTGKQLFEKYTEPRDDYARLLLTLRLNLGDQLHRLLEQAEKAGKRLGVTPEPDDHMREEYTLDDVIFV